MRTLVLPAGFLAALTVILLLPVPEIVGLVLIGVLFVGVVWLLPTVGCGGCGCNRQHGDRSE